jgi:hypothetical protein
MRILRPSLVFALLCLVALFCGAFWQAHAALSTRSVTQLAELTASDGAAGDVFGFAVAVSGDTMVVGALGSDGARGAAYVFANSGTGWAQVAKLTASDSAANQRFGTSVAVSGGTAVVGANGGNSPGLYIFVEPAGGWRDMTQTAKLTYGNALGSTVAISDNEKIVVDGESSQGQAFVYVEQSNGWQNTTEPTAFLHASISAQLGTSVAISGKTVVVGAPGEANGHHGAAFVFLLQGKFRHIGPSATLLASDGVNGDLLGSSVAIDGDTVVAGAPDHSGSGAVYVFVKPASGWHGMTQVAELGLSTPQRALLGFSVALLGDRVLAGAPNDVIGERAQGAAFGYVKPANGWVNTSAPNASAISLDGAVSDQFGWSVALSRTVALIGAPHHAVGGNAAQGAAYVFGAK